jgi:RNA polymerase sigma-70 factor (sigma-E family)
MCGFQRRNTPLDAGRIAAYGVNAPAEAGVSGSVTTMVLPLRRNVAVDDPLTALHRDHYRSLVRLASLLLGDVESSEEVVQDAFVKMHTRLGGVRDPEKAPAYLRSVVLNGARSLLRKRKVRERHAERRSLELVNPSAENGAIGSAEHSRMLAALGELPERQREALVLRYYLDLSEADIAAAMGVSAGSVKTHIHRGLASLTQRLEEEAR